MGCVNWLIYRSLAVGAWELKPMDKQASCRMLMKPGVKSQLSRTKIMFLFEFTKKKWGFVEKLSLFAIKYSVFIKKQGARFNQRLPAALLTILWLWKINDAITLFLSSITKSTFSFWVNQAIPPLSPGQTHQSSLLPAAGCTSRAEWHSSLLM